VVKPKYGTVQKLRAFLQAVKQKSDGLNLLVMVMSSKQVTPHANDW